MRILIACESSGEVREAFRRLGHDAWSCDLLPADDGSINHYEGDALRVAKSSHWDMMIAHPPCTYLCNSGVRWLSTKSDDLFARQAAQDRQHQMMKAAHFFMDLYELPIPKIVIENPIMHGHAKKALAIPRQTQVIQPWHFGDEAFKATCLWIKGDLDPLDTRTYLRLDPPKPGTAEHKRWSAIHRAPPGPDRWKIRSKTFPGIAQAMARTWG